MQLPLHPINHDCDPAPPPAQESDFHSAMKAVRAIMSEGGAAADDVGADAGGSGAASST